MKRIVLAVAWVSISVGCRVPEPPGSVAAPDASSLSDPPVTPKKRDPREELADLDQQARSARGYEGPALVILGRAISKAEAAGDAEAAAVLWSRLGTVYERRGEFQAAVIAFESGVRVLDGLEPLSTIGRRGGKGFGRKTRPMSPADLAEVKPAADLEEAARDPELAATLLMQVGNAYAQQPQLNPALVAYDLALKRLPAGSQGKVRAALAVNMGTLLVRAERLVEAEEALTEATRLVASAPAADQRRLRISNAELARAKGERALETNELARADALYREALPLYDAREAEGRAKALAGHGWVLLGLGQPRPAATSFERALELAERVKDEQLIWTSRAGLGRALIRLGQESRAVAVLTQAMNEVWLVRERHQTDEGRVALMETAAGLVDDLVELQFRRGKKDPEALRQALAISEAVRGSALEDLSNSVPWANTADEPRPPQPAGCQDWDSYLEQNQHVQSALATRSLGSFVLSANPRWPSAPGHSEPSSQITPDAAVSRSRYHRVVFHVLAEDTLVFTVSPNGTVKGHRAKLGREALAQKVAEFRESLGISAVRRGVSVDSEPSSGDRSAHQRISRELYSALIAPIQRVLPSDGALLVVEPHDSMWALPLAALEGPDGKFVGERWPLLWAPSSRTLTREAPREPPPRATSRAFVFAQENPSIARLEWSNEKITFKPLAGAAREGAAIAALFPLSLVARDEQRTVTGALQALHEYDVIHFATHGVALAENPQDSFLLLDKDPACGEFLTARMATGLSLKADLVTLSACETGLGRITGDGMVGLARSFIVAGARTVVMSQWSVDDQATEALMTAFYRAYVRGADKPSALREAMLEVRQDPRWKSPLYWAPFVTFGAE